MGRQRLPQRGLRREHRDHAGRRARRRPDWERDEELAAPLPVAHLSDRPWNDDLESTWCMQPSGGAQAPAHVPAYSARPLTHATRRDPSTTGDSELEPLGLVAAQQALDAGGARSWEELRLCPWEVRSSLDPGSADRCRRRSSKSASVLSSVLLEVFVAAAAVGATAQARAVRSYAGR